MNGNMKKQIDSTIEKLFFNYTLENIRYIRYVHGYFFKNEHIRFVYDVIRNEYMLSDKNTEFNLSIKEVMALIKMYDEKDFIEQGFIKALFKINLEEYTEDFVMKRYEPWIKSNLMLNGLMKSYEAMRDVNVIDEDTVDKALTDIKENIDSALTVKLRRGDIGLDFDNVEDHNQLLEHNKITSGFPTFDMITEGGFDRKTLTIFMGAPGAGKCCSYDTVIHIRNKNTKEVLTLTIGEYYDMMKIEYDGKNINPSYPEPEVQ